jgi:uncharacterized protein
MHSIPYYLLAVLLIIAAAILLWVVCGALFIAWASTHPHRSAVFSSTPGQFGAPYEEVAFASAAGDVQLSGWVISAEDPRGIVIVCHGMHSDRTELLNWVEPLWKAGFSALVFDFRALGKSEGSIATAGVLETHDFLGALNFVAEHPALIGLPIGVFGFSMGGAVAIAGSATDTRIQAIAVHGAFATLDRAIQQRCRKHFGVFARPAAFIIRRCSALWMPVRSSEFTPLAHAPKLAPRPLLVMHGDNDSIIPVQDARDLHAAAPMPDGLHIFPNSGHRHIHEDHQTRAYALLVNFFTQHLH